MNPSPIQPHLWLPSELWQTVFQFVSLAERVQLKRCCRAWFNIISDLCIPVHVHIFIHEHQSGDESKDRMWVKVKEVRVQDSKNRVWTSIDLHIPPNPHLNLRDPRHLILSTVSKHLSHPTSKLNASMSLFTDSFQQQGMDVLLAVSQWCRASMDVAAYQSYMLMQLRDQDLVRVLVVDHQWARLQTLNRDRGGDGGVGHDVLRSVKPRRVEVDVNFFEWVSDSEAEVVALLQEASRWSRLDHLDPSNGGHGVELCVQLDGGTVRSASTLMMTREMFECFTRIRYMSALNLRFYNCMFSIPADLKSAHHLGGMHIGRLQVSLGRAEMRVEVQEFMLGLGSCCRLVMEFHHGGREVLEYFCVEEWIRRVCGLQSAMLVVRGTEWEEEDTRNVVRKYADLIGKKSGMRVHKIHYPNGFTLRLSH